MSFYKDKNLRLSEDKSTKSTSTLVTESTNVTEKLRILLWQLEWHFTACLLANGNVGTVKNRCNKGITTNAGHMSVIRSRVVASVFFMI